MVLSEGTAFVQKGTKAKGGGKQDKEKKGDGKLKLYNKKFFADKECFNYGKLGHRADLCPNQAADDNKPSKKGKARKKDEDDNNALVSSSKKLKKGFKKMQKTLTQLSDKIDEGNELITPRRICISNLLPHKSLWMKASQRLQMCWSSLISL